MEASESAPSMSKVGTMVLLLGEANTFKSHLRCQVFDWQNRSQQQAGLPESQSRSPLLRRS
jgi:hypothetical protein